MEASLVGGKYALKVYVQPTGSVELAVVSPTNTLSHLTDAAVYYLGLSDVNAPIAESYLGKVLVSQEVSQRVSLENPDAYKTFITAHPNQIRIP